MKEDPTYEREYRTKSKQKQLFGKRDKYRVLYIAVKGEN